MRDARPVGQMEHILHHDDADHVHLLTAPLDRELSVAAFLKWFNRSFNESYDAGEKWRWQPGGFDSSSNVGVNSRKVGTTSGKILFGLAGSCTGRNGDIERVFATTSRDFPNV